MYKSFMLTLILSIIYTMTSGQGYIVRGKVIDEQHTSLIGAVVVVHPDKRGTVTNSNGEFSFHIPDKGTYKIEVSFMGYVTHLDTIQIEDDLIYNVTLNVSSLSLQEVVVGDHYAETRKKEEALNVEVVNDEYLKQNMGGSLTSSLERLPGVSAYSIGSGQSKPVIRGLGFNRVVVSENGIKHEAQQWGADHGLEVDQYAVENIVVIKGPASLMYGSDAIGGVIEMKNRSIPAENSFGGSVDLTGKTNNQFLGTSLALYGRKKWFLAEARATILDYGDYRVPTDSVDIYSYRAALDNNHMRNTAGKEQNLHLTLGIVSDRFHSKFYMSNISSKNGFFANAHGLEPRNIDTDLHDKSNRDIQHPYQNVQHTKLINRTHYTWDRARFELDLGAQRNFRQEWSEYVNHGYMPPTFPDTLGYQEELERQFDLFVYSGSLKLFYDLSEMTGITFGGNGEYHDNDIGGRGFIIPAYKQVNLGAFIFAKHAFSEQSSIQAGIRYDYGKINTSEYFDWFQSPVIVDGDTSWQYLQRAEAINRSFSNFSWSFGYIYTPANWSFRANIGKGFRMPIAKELAANGVNYHQFSYEVGNPDLSPETSYQFDVGIEYHNENFALGTTPFVNYFSNYIYLNPSAEHDRLYGNGNQVYYYQESEVLRYGAEIHAHYELFKSLKLGIIGEYVYSEQLSGEKKGFTLPFSPPPSLILNLKYQKQRISFMEHPYISVDYRLTAAQNNVVPPEEPTDGYQLINLGLGSSLKFRTQKIKLALQVQNLLNTKYLNHTSYYRLINVPEPGRNIILNITIPFSGNF